jgi:hypothetical protein
VAKAGRVVGSLVQVTGRVERVVERRGAVVAWAVVLVVA